MGSVTESKGCQDRSQAWVTRSEGHGAGRRDSGQDFRDTRGRATGGEGNEAGYASVCPRGPRTLCQWAGNVVLRVDSQGLWPLGHQTFSFPGHPWPGDQGIWAANCPGVLPEMSSQEGPAGHF